ncbi:cytochrome c oxidase subunit 3 [Mangrovibrevibacter kandeliae]|uniref:cytochrome c oxidase subunit 3 n=1 Tax=Mangrovibrevibacter kandeliae TaxID=2968473 RepID=UPI0021196254|nr:cytochrome c oxidase subunit 3 [Aurantimonas sp. CSK15Z-1]MCQ8783988.1 cytochrome c oxidase subunit 3 [Aurantimonas sp. CSK15Z-1]
MSSPALHEPFEAIDRQRLSAALGMWVFLASEILFFGSLFLGFTVYRSLHPQAILEAGRETNVVFGSVNTAILLISSVTMAVADKAAERGLRRMVVGCLAATAALGLAFLVLKGLEYREDIHEHLVPGPDFKLKTPAAQLFFGFYWSMTAIHAVHLTIGIAAVCLFAWRVSRRAFDFTASAALPSLGLYWHLVDIIWIFLYPLLYLGGRAP